VSCRTAFPFAYDRLGIEAGGTENTQGNFGAGPVRCGGARVQLLRKAYPLGMDPQTGVDMYRYEELPRDVVDSIVKTNPQVIIKLEGSMPLLGLNLLGAWGLKVDAYAGLVKCDEPRQQQMEVKVEE
jgi:hypothetical protein